MHPDPPAAAGGGAARGGGSCTCGWWCTRWCGSQLLTRRTIGCALCGQEPRGARDSHLSHRPSARTAAQAPAGPTRAVTITVRGIRTHINVKTARDVASCREHRSRDTRRMRARAAGPAYTHACIGSLYSRRSGLCTHTHMAMRPRDRHTTACDAHTCSRLLRGIC